MLPCSPQSLYGMRQPMDVRGQLRFSVTTVFPTANEAQGEIRVSNGKWVF